MGAAVGGAADPEAVQRSMDGEGNKAIALTEIDYLDILRERAGGVDSATWSRILTAMKDDKDEENEEASDKKREGKRAKATRK